MIPGDPHAAYLDNAASQAKFIKLRRVEVEALHEPTKSPRQPRLKSLHHVNHNHYNSAWLDQ